MNWDSTNIKEAAIETEETDVLVTVRLNTWCYYREYENCIKASYQRVSEVMFITYLIPVGDWECCLCSCSCSPPPAGSGAEESPS